MPRCSKKETDGDLKMAGAVLSLLKYFVQTEVSKLAKLGNSAGQGVVAAGEAPFGIAESIGKGVADSLNGAKERARVRRRKASKAFSEKLANL